LRSIVGMEALIARLEREAEERCAELLTEAEGEAERVRQEAETRFERRREEAQRVLDEELRRQDAAAGAAARTSVRTVLLRARRNALDRVFQQARALLPEAVRTEAWASSVTADLRQALACLGDTDVVVSCPAGLGDTLRTAASSILKAEPSNAASGTDDRRIQVQEGEDASPGFEVRGTVTGVRVDVTLPTRLAGARPELEMRVLEDLEARR